MLIQEVQKLEIKQGEEQKNQINFCASLTLNTFIKKYRKALYLYRIIEN